MMEGGEEEGAVKQRNEIWSAPPLCFND